MKRVMRSRPAAVEIERVPEELFCHESEDVAEMIEKIKETPGRNDKRALLVEMRDHFRFALEVMLAVFDIHVTYGIKKVPDPRMLPHPEGRGETIFRTLGPFTSHTMGLLADLASRKLTGNAAQDAIALELGRLLPASRGLLVAILQQNLRAGFSEEVVNDVWGPVLKVINIQLAHEYTDRKGKPNKHRKFPGWIDVKYDGTRGFWLESENDTRPVSGFFSRAGLPLEVPPSFAELIVKFLEEVKGYAFHPDDKLFLDCEIVSLKGGFADVMSQVRASKRGASEGTTGIRIIDILTEDEYKAGKSMRDQRARRHLLEDIAAQAWFIGYAEFIALTEGEEVKDDLQVQAFYQKVLAGGGEGAMFKLYEGFWEGKRSNGWQKIKPREKTSGIVVGWKPGAKNSKWEGHLGAVQVRLESGVKVFVGGMTDKTREYLLDNIDMLIAQEVEVEVGFHEVTPDGSLRHPRIGLVRDDK